MGDFPQKGGITATVGKSSKSNIEYFKFKYKVYFI